MQNQESNTQVKPFFAHFLEEQHPAAKQSQAAGPETRKYPSDSEDDMETYKYPSDWEDD